MESSVNLFQKKNLSPERAGKIAWRMFSTPQNSRQPLSTREQKLADRAEKLCLETENRKITYYRWKPSINKENKRVLLIHGWNYNALSFVALTKSLLDEGFEVVSFDGPAHGESSGQRANIIEFAINAQAVIEEIGNFYAMIGHSIGGMTISYMMNGHSPAHYLSSLEKLVMISTPDRLFDIINNFLKVAEIPLSVMEGIDLEVQRLSGRSIEWYSTSNFSKTIETPLLLIHDRSDEEAPLEGAEKVASNAVNSKIVITEKLGHNLTIRSPKVIKEIIAFL